jgi:methionyl-tRNA synthetase
LVGIFGNFINRVAVLIHKYYDGVVPQGDVNSPELKEIKQQKKFQDSLKIMNSEMLYLH